MKADKSGKAPQVDALLERLGNPSKGIPFYAIYPAGRPDEPVTMDGLYISPEPFLKALRKAVSGQPAGARAVETPKRVDADRSTSG